MTTQKLDNTNSGLIYCGTLSCVLVIVHCSSLDQARQYKQWVDYCGTLSCVLVIVHCSSLDQVRQY